MILAENETSRKKLSCYFPKEEELCEYVNRNIRKGNERVYPHNEGAKYCDTIGHKSLTFRIKNLFTTEEKRIVITDNIKVGDRKERKYTRKKTTTVTHHTCKAEIHKHNP